MAKYHIREDGTWGLCTAEKGKCPFGKHYDKKEDAVNASRALLEAEHMKMQKRRAEEISEEFENNLIFEFDVASHVEENYAPIFEKMSEKEVRKRYDKAYSKLFKESVRDVSDIEMNEMANVNCVSLLMEDGEIGHYYDDNADALRRWAQYQVVKQYYKENPEEKEYMSKSLRKSLESDWQEGRFDSLILELGDPWADNSFEDFVRIAFSQEIGKKRKSKLWDDAFAAKPE